METSRAILERWVSRTIESYPAQMHSFLRSEGDPFRNPVGHAIKENLGTLVRELLGGMDKNAMAPALDALLRLRAVQDFSPADAVRFVFDLRTIVREVSGQVDDLLQSRIDSLALATFDQYMACREHIFELRMKEVHFRAQYSGQ
jgi:RsbT co-antagonist protein rsbRD N-terminal domain